MCGMSNVAGAAGGGPPGKVTQQTGVAGASGDAPTKVAGASGGGGDAGAGAAALGGGGDLASILSSLTASVKALAEAVSKMGAASGGGGMAGCGMGATKVAGVQGGAATKAQLKTVQSVSNSPVTTRKDEDNAFEQKVLELINAERQKAGLAPVSYNGTLDNSAEKHAVHMAGVGKMAHDGIGDGDPGARARAEGWRNAWGENVATGQTSPEQVVREWMASPTHRRNILDPNFRNMGVGYVTAANGRSYWAQEFGA
ncbi:MAG: hypothetical protein JWL76_1220 [Thermoleophilia bacterium]|nr:hypothetical protein [Thermoleophilia bacterium]